jgi:hypothetical protein
MNVHKKKCNVLEFVLLDVCHLFAQNSTLWTTFLVVLFGLSGFFCPRPVVLSARTCTAVNKGLPPNFISLWTWITLETTN